MDNESGMNISNLIQQLDKLEKSFENIKKDAEELAQAQERFTEEQKDDYGQLEDDINVVSRHIKMARDETSKGGDVAIDVLNKVNEKLELTSQFIQRMTKTVDTLKQSMGDVTSAAENISTATPTVNTVTNPNAGNPIPSPNPRDWANWNTEINRAITNIEKLSTSTRGLSEEQQAQMTEYINNIRSIDETVRGRYESERAIQQADHNSVLQQQQLAAALRDRALAEQAEQREQEKLEGRYHTVYVKLSEYISKNYEAIASNDELREKFGELVMQFRGDLSTDGLDRVKVKFSELKKEVTQVTKASQEAAREAKALAIAQASEIATLTETIRMRITNGLYNFAIKQIRAIFNAVAELDEKLVEIRKVTDFSDSELDTFVENIKNIGQATATTTSQLLDASAVFARSGYTQEQIEMLTEEAAVLKNVSDGITDMGKSAEILISVMKAYRVPAEEARNITDQLNNISNNAAISFDDLADGISRIGSVFAAQDTSIGELSAMLTGANEILQNIEKTSNGLKTISQRLRAIKADVNEGVLGVASLQGLFDSIINKYGETVRITDEATGQLRGTYDILKDLAGVWNSLTSNEQQLLGEKIAGKNQITVLQALLNNWQSVEVAIKNVDTATGSAAREQQAMLNSLTGAVNNLKASLQNMYASATSSESLSIIVKLLTQVIKLVDWIGIDVIALSAGASAIVGKMYKIRDYVGNYLAVFKQIREYTDAEAVGLTKLKNIWDFLTKNSTALSQSLVKKLDVEGQILGLSEEESTQMRRLLNLSAEGNLAFADRIALSKLANKATDEEIRKLGVQLGLEKSINSTRMIGIGLMVAAAAVAFSAVSKIVQKHIDEVKNAVKNVTQEFEDAKTKVKDLESQLTDIYSAIEESNGEITKQQQEQVEELRKQLILARAIALEKERERANEINNQTGSYGHYDVETDTSSTSAYFREWNEEAKKWIETSVQDMKQFFDENGEFIKEKYDEAIKYISEHNIDTLKSIGEAADAEGQEVLDFYEKIENGIVETKEEADEIIQNGLTKETFAKALEEFYKVGDDVFDELGNFDFDKALDNIKIDFETATKLAKKFGISVDELIGRFYQLNGESVETWQQEYSQIAAVERKLKDYVDLYTDATNGMKAKDLMNVIDNWAEYADILDVENGQLVLSKELIIAKAKAQIESVRNELISQREELGGQIAIAEAELALRKASAGRAKGTIEDINKVLKQKMKEVAVNNALISGENGISVSAGAVASAMNSFASSAGYASYSTAELEQAIANMKKQYASLTEQIEALGKLDIEAMLKKAAAAAKKGGKSAKSAKKAVDELKEALEALKKVLSELERQMSETTDVYEQIQAAMQEIIEAEIAGIEAENDALDENMEYYRARIQLLIEAYEEQIAALEAEQEAAEAANQAQQDAIEAQIEALQEETEAYEEQIEAQQDAIDEQIAALKARQKAIDDAAKAEKEELDMEQRLLDIEKARLAVEKAKDAYEQAKNSKTVRTYDAERGWIWTANQQNVESAYNAYTSAQANYDKLLQDYFDKLAEMEREAEKAALQEEIDALEAQKDALDELLEAAKENAKAEEEALRAALEALKEEQKAIEDGYKAQIDALQQQIDQLNSIEDNVERAVNKYLNDQGVLDWVEAYLNASDEERAAMEEELAGIWQADREHQIANEEKIEELNDLLQQIADMLNVTNEILDSEGVKAWLEAFSNGDYDERTDMIQEMRDAYLEFYNAQQAEIKKIQDQIAQLEGTLNYTNMLLENWGTGEGYTPVHHYANGGVVDSGLLSHTGMLSDYVKVHGNPGNPELILNGRQQANLLYRLAQMKPTPIGTTPSYTTESMYIANLTITADSQDTLRGLLLQAKQLASVS